MTAFGGSKVKVQMGIALDWMERHPNMPAPMKHNARKFLENQAELHPDLDAWCWLTKTFQLFGDIKLPFGWIKAVLANPWMQMPGEKHEYKKPEGEEGKGKGKDLHTKSISIKTSSLLIPSPPSPDPKAEAVWASAKEQIRGQITRPAFQTWIADVVGMAHEGGRFVLGVSSAFAGEQLAQRMYQLLQRALSDAVGGEIEVDFALSPVSIS